MLPESSPPEKQKRSWGERFKALFTQPVKLPGWAAVLLVILEVVPDWKGRIDFWLGVAKASGGYLAMAAAVVASPFFTRALLIAGLAWIIFAGEPDQGVQRHHWLRYVGWSVFLICFTAVVLTAGYGAFEIAIQDEVGIRDTQLQKRYAIRPVYWHLTDYQKTILAAELGKIPEKDRFPIQILCLPDAGSRTYVTELGDVFLNKNWKVTANCLFNDLRPDFIGLSIGIAPSLKGTKFEALPKNIQTLAKVFTLAKLPAQWSFDKPGSSADTFFIIVGNAP